MPLYEYSCGSCETVFEARLPRSDAPDPGCPSCGGSEVERLFSAFAVSTGAPAFGARNAPPCQGGPTAPGCGSCERN